MRSTFQYDTIHLFSLLIQGYSKEKLLLFEKWLMYRKTLEILNRNKQ